MSPELVHTISITNEKCKCGSPGHRDAIARCSCGEFEYVNSHMSYNDAMHAAIADHRLSTIEAVLAIRFSIEHEGRR